MELQLGLGLSSNPINLIGFDLNSYWCEPKEVLGSDPLRHVGSSESIGDCKSNLKKRSFDAAFDVFEQQGKDVLPQTLALLLWDCNHPNEEDDDDHTELDKNSSTINKSDGEDDGVVGWPPIKSWRKKFCHRNQNSGAGNERAVNYICGGGGGGGGGGDGCGSKSTYVKVKMEGVAIARKVDLSLHQSYQSLMDTLVSMFGIGEIGQENEEDYELTYQDREGDWLLAGDVPWSSFIQSVQRLKLLRTRD